jgi:hypothetical protein
MIVTFNISKDEAMALLRFLREVAYLETDSVIKTASVKVRIAIRDKIEPGWRDKE